jgi:alpha-glucoside transport system substrate-binding protein
MKQRKLLLMTTVAAGLLAAGCGSTKSTTAATTVAPATTAAATTAAPTTTAAAATTTAAAATTTAAAATTVAAPAQPKGSLLGTEIKCDNQFKGKEVHISSPVRNSDTNKGADRLRDAYAPLEKCTGMKVVYDGSAEFETEIKVKLAGGNPPDVIDWPQPGGLADQIAKGTMKAFPDTLAKAVQTENLDGWPQLATVGGKVYAVPARANVKSIIWYSPKMFKDKGYALPTTFEEVKTLSDKIVADGGTPWCVGIASGVATGWAITDWFEDFMLRINGPEVYDQWVQHKIPFNDPKVKAVADAVASYVKNDKYIGSANAVKAIATTKFEDGGLPILEGKCYMHKQASFYVDFWGKDTKIGPDGQVNFAYFPSPAGGKKYMLGGGDLISAGTDKPETFALLAYTNSAQYQTDIIAAGSGDLSTRKDFDTTTIKNPNQKGFADLLKGSDIFRFDGADMMPAKVGSGSFWKEATAWILGGNTTDLLNNIEKSWT